MTALSPQSDPVVRASGLGGSDIAKVMGLSRFGGPFDLYLEKIGQSAPLIETGPMRWGKLLEEPIAREYALQTGRTVRRVNRTLRHPKYPFLFAHLDRRATKKGEAPRILEAKTAGVFMASDFGEPGSDAVPDDYYLQLQHYLGVTGMAVADLAVLIGGQKFALYEVPRDDEIIAEIHAEATRFWLEHVVPRVPPDIDGSEAASAYLASKFKDRGTATEMTEEIKRLAFAYKGAVAFGASAEQQKKEIGNKLRSLLGEASVAEGDGVTVKWSTVAAYTVKAHEVAEQRRLSVHLKD